MRSAVRFVRPRWRYDASGLGRTYPKALVTYLPEDALSLVPSEVYNYEQ